KSVQPLCNNFDQPARPLRAIAGSWETDNLMAECELGRRGPIVLVSARALHLVGVPGSQVASADRNRGWNRRGLGSHPSRHDVGPGRNADPGHAILRRAKQAKRSASGRAAWGPDDLARKPFRSTPG